MYISINNKLSSHGLIIYIYRVSQKCIGGIIYVLVGLWKEDPCRFQSLIIVSSFEKWWIGEGGRGEGGEEDRRGMGVWLYIIIMTVEFSRIFKLPSLLVHWHLGLIFADYYKFSPKVTQFVKLTLYKICPTCVYNEYCIMYLHCVSIVVFAIGVDML